MEPAEIIAAVSAALVSIGGAVAWLIKRADGRRDNRENAVAELLKNRIVEQDEELATKGRELRAERKAHSKMKATAGKWREQLIAHGIQPDPADWPEANDHG